MNDIPHEHFRPLRYEGPERRHLPTPEFSPQQLRTLRDCMLRAQPLNEEELVIFSYVQLRLNLAEVPA